MKIWLPTVKTGSGTDVFTRQLANGLMARGISPTINWFPHILELAPSLLKGVSPPQGTDIIHTNSWHGFAFARTDIPMVTTVHHCVHDMGYAPYRSLMQSIYHKTRIYRHERHSFALSDAVVADSHFTAERVTEAFPGTHPIVIYAGVDHEFFVPDHAPTTKDGPFRLLYVGNPTRRKGFDLLIPIMERLGKGFKLSITSGLRGGKSPGAANIESLGRLDDRALLKAYQDCDALLFPSRYEGFGYVVCEAMACGKPVVTSNNSALTEVVNDGETGFLCPTDDIDAYCQAIRNLASDPVLAGKMGDAGRSRVIEHFTLDRVAANYAELYERLLNDF